MANEIAKNLLENALEFSKRASKDLANEDYKFSLIHFCAAIEQILKARLVLEHWMLIIDKNSIDSATFAKFECGDTATITITSVLGRSENLFDNVNDAYTKCIGHLIKERNKIIHFYNLKVSNSKENLNIVRTIYKAWYLTHDIIDTTQKLNRFKKKFNLINIEMMKFDDYLGIIYDEKKPEIDKLIKAGDDIIYCKICGRLAFHGDVSDELIKDGRCIVCAYNEIYIKIRCEKCQTSNYLFPSRSCELKLNCCNHECQATIACDDDEVLNELQDISDDPKHGYHYASCSECNTQGCVGMFKNIWLCSSCLSTHDSLFECECCGERVTGYKEDTYLSGCGFCNGRLEYD